MRKIIVFNNVTLDGFFAGPNGELDWSNRADEESVDLAREGQTEADAYMFGRVTYEMMASYWPTEQAKAQNPVFAEALNNHDKFVFSRAVDKAEWEHTRLLKSIERDAILALKNGPGKNILIFGSGTIVRQLAKLNLIDEYQLIVNPVILGMGKALFEGMARMQFRLAGSHAFRNGNVLLRYAPEEG